MLKSILKMTSNYFDTNIKPSTEMEAVRVAVKNDAEFHARKIIKPVVETIKDKSAGCKIVRKTYNNI